MAVSLGFGLLLVSIALVFYQFRTYARLCNFPGPLLAAFSNLWRFKKMNTVGFGQQMVQLHRQYGHIVRVGPNRLSISDPSAVSIIYSAHSVWEKVCSLLRHQVTPATDHHVGSIVRAVCSSEQW